MEVLSLRETELFELPVVRVITEDQLEEEFFGSPIVPQSPTPYERVLTLLTLLPETTTQKDAQKSNLSNILAFYSSSNKEVVMVDRGIPLTDPQSIRTLAHEFVHAVQDQETDIAALKRAATTIEASFRVRSLIEGEARLVDTMFDARQNGLSPDNINWSRTYQRYDDYMESLLAETDTPYIWATSSSLYLYGSRWLQKQLETVDQPIREALISGLPISSAAFFAIPLGIEPEPRNSVTCSAPPPPVGLETDYTTEMGPAILYAFIRRLGMSQTGATRLAAAWAGDFLNVYANNQDETSAAWQLLLADGTERQQWLTLLDEQFDGIYITSPEQVTLLLGSPEVNLSAWTWPSSDNYPPECANPP
ncbi:MAG: hypothetical protein KTR25_19010 [Myxococcales bacterium]|nr:hypothetical protein [Myxococcales bacterium]